MCFSVGVEWNSESRPCFLHQLLAPERRIAADLAIYSFILPTLPPSSSGLAVLDRLHRRMTENVEGRVGERCVFTFALRVVKGPLSISVRVGVYFH